MSVLVPYNGLRVREHFGEGRGGHTISSYGNDQSHTKRYTFNSLGFRGEEFNAAARRHIFVCGCSYAFGTGLDLEETWASQLKVRLARRWALDASDVNLLNFSQGAASNGYITRVLISQATRFRPDLIIALFTHNSRYELYGRASAAHVQASVLPLYAGTEWADRVEHSWLAASAEDDAMRFVFNVLLLQAYCRAHGIWLLCGSIEAARSDTFFDDIKTPLNAPLLAALDRGLFAPLTGGMFVDTAADGTHPGPRSQELFAGAFMTALDHAYPEHATGCTAVPGL